MQRPAGIRWPRVAAVAVVAVCLAYAPIAATELWSYADPGAPAPGQWLLARAVDPPYVAQALATRIGPYRHSLAAMVVHSVLGGALMVLGPVQLLSALRRRPRLHRATGVVFAVTVYASMAAAGVYLARTAPADAFGGAAFWIVLATILVGTVLSTTFGVLAAATRFPDLHQRWLLLCYGYLMTAPLLRLEWGALPVLLPGLPMAEVNRVALMHLGSLVVLGALLASRALDRRATVAGVQGSWVPRPVLVGTGLLGLLALALIADRMLGLGATGRRLLLAYLLPYLACYALLLVRRHRDTAAGRPWAREEWGLHLAALSLAPVLSAALAPLLGHALRLDRLTAWSAAVAVGCGVAAFATTAVVALRLMYARELLKGASR
ncbi:DUF2306 domain-containing protein [Kitasatospora sp. NPDC058965]|uniref:DUF2306 domain-containing protein n=1 Tax=Kitasatospora sp. NPDC058965 TaxID=3346682 RepID=UPI00369D1180